MDRQDFGDSAIHETETDRSAFVIAYALVAASGALVGLALGWMIWG